MKTKLLLLFAVFMTAFSVNSQVTSVALVGTAVGGWPGEAGNPGPVDINQLTQIDADNWKIEGITIAAGPCKLRANNCWCGAGFEWAGAFPTATGTSSGDIIVPIGGVYTVTLNTATGVYNFDSGTPLAVVKLVGTAVTGGTVTMSPTSPSTFSLSNATLLAGNGQFEVDGVLYGGTGFPTGTADSPTSFIPVAAGTYSTITLDISSGDYVFTAAPVYPSIAIVGSGAGGWPSDPQVDANVLTTTDGVTYKGSKIALTAGEIKFRSNNNWSDPNWGGVTFPTGPDASNPGGNIVVTVPGTYDVTFDRPTGAYTFFFPTIALVGSGAGGWPSDPQVDANVLTTTDGVTYTRSGQAITDGEVKFRQGNAWDVNWGAADFPTGTGTQGGANILTVAGTYDVTLDRVSGVYNFGTLSTSSFTKSNFKVFPNPSNANWNFTSSKEVITSIQVIDMLGKVVATSTSTTVDASALTTGVYFAKVATATATETIKVVKN